MRVDAWSEWFNSSLSHKSGIRHVELVQDDTNAGNVTGKTFYCKVNNVPVFVKGANWIPTDSFPTRVRASTVRHLLESVHAANMNMVSELEYLSHILDDKMLIKVLILIRFGSGEVADMNPTYFIPSAIGWVS